MLALMFAADDITEIYFAPTDHAFDPRKAMKTIESKPAHPGEEKIGLRLIKSITDRYGAFDYQNTAGINTSIVELRG